MRRHVARDVAVVCLVWAAVVQLASWERPGLPLLLSTAAAVVLLLPDRRPGRRRDPTA
ncbi:hypothetical protein [Modestobacter sp. SYSU DS0657]